MKRRVLVIISVLIITTLSCSFSSLFDSFGSTGTSFIYGDREITIQPVDIEKPEQALRRTSVEFEQMGNQIAMYVEAPRGSNLQSQYLLVKPEELDDEQKIYLTADPKVTIFEDVEFDPGSFEEVEYLPGDSTWKRIEDEVGDYDYVLFADRNVLESEERIRNSVLHFYDTSFENVKYIWLDSDVSSSGGGVVASRLQQSVFTGGVGVSIPWHILGSSALEHFHINAEFGDSILVVMCRLSGGISERNTNLCSSPAVYEEIVYDRVYLEPSEGYKDELVAEIESDNGWNENGQFGIDWKFPTGGEIFWKPESDKGNLFFSNADGTINAVDSESGNQIWRFPTGSQPVSSPLLFKNTLYVGNENGVLFAIDQNKGEELWRFETAGRISGKPTVSGSSVLFGSESTIYAVDTKTGDEQWQLEVGEGYSIKTSLISSAQTVYFGAGESIYAVDIKDQDVLWTFQSDSNIYGPPVIDGGVLYFGNSNGSVYAVNKETGEDIWNTQTDQEYGIYSTPIIEGNLLIFGVDRYIYALNIGTGEIEWKFETYGMVFSDPIISKKVLYFGSEDSYIYAVDLDSGKELWSYSVSEAPVSSPLLLGDRLYIGSSDKHLYSLSENGDQGLPEQEIDPKLLGRWKQVDSDSFFTDEIWIYENTIGFPDYDSQFPEIQGWTSGWVEPGKLWFGKEFQPTGYIIYERIDDQRIRLTAIEGKEKGSQEDWGIFEKTETFPESGRLPVSQNNLMGYWSDTESGNGSGIEFVDDQNLLMHFDEIVRCTYELKTPGSSMSILRSDCDDDYYDFTYRIRIPNENTIFLYDVNDGDWYDLDGWGRMYVKESDTYEAGQIDESNLVPNVCANNPNESVCSVIEPGSSIKIGVGGPMSDYLSVYGTDILNAGLLAVEDAENFEGFNFELLMDDTRGNLEGGIETAERFVSDPDVVAVAGYILTGSMRDAIPIYNEARLPVLSPSALGTDLVLGDQDVFNRICYTSDLQGKNTAEYIFNEMGVSSIAIIHDGNDYNLNIVEGVSNTFTNLGGEVLAVDEINPEEETYKSSLSAIKKIKPEMIYLAVFHLDASEIAKDLQNLDYIDVILFGSDGVYSEHFIANADRASEGVYAASPRPLPSARVDEFKKTYENAYGYIPGELTDFTWHGYDVVSVLIDGIKSVGILGDDGNLYIPREELITYVNNLDGYPGLIGEISCRSGECNVDGPSFMMVQDGDWIFPEEGIALSTSGIIFEDGFSTDKGWIDESGGNIFLDETNERVEWNVVRSDTRRYYIPINAISEHVKVSYHFNVANFGGNGNVNIGLVEDLVANTQHFDYAATGIFARINHHDGWNGIGVDAVFHDLDLYRMTGDRINIGNTGTWLQVEMTVDQRAWNLKLKDEAGTLIGERSGTLPKEHTAYKYFMIFKDETSGWENSRGFFDDLEIRAREAEYRLTPISLEEYGENEGIYYKLQDLVTVTESESPGRGIYQSQADVGTPIVLFRYWATTTNSILEENWPKIEYRLTIDGKEVDRALLEQWEGTVGGWPYRGYATLVTGLEPGEYHIEWTMIIKEKINDGDADYKAGEYKREYYLLVQ